MFDVIVVGGGPAGLSAALMLGRCRRRVLVCDLGQPRNRRSQALHGYLTRDGIAPAAFLEAARRELAQYGIECRMIGVTAAARADDDRFRVTLSDGRDELARFLLLATGVIDDLPLVPGLEECYGRSVFHCPYCDGWEWRDRRLAALGSGADAAKLALALTAWSRDVVLCTNGARVHGRDRRRLEHNGIAIRTDAVSRLVHDAGALTAIVFRGGSLERDALFFSTAQHPQSDIATRVGCALTAHGTVRTGTLSDTNVPRVFVAGDAARDAQFAIVAAAEGIKAAVAINKALLHEELAP